MFFTIKMFVCFPRNHTTSKFLLCFYVLLIKEAVIKDKKIVNSSRKATPSNFCVLNRKKYKVLLQDVME